MNPEQNPTTSSDFTRPSARAAATPVQRANYGIPPRQTAPLTSGPRSMDIMAPRRPTAPAAPAAPTPRPVAQPIATAPSQSSVVAQQIAIPPTQPRPLYTNTPAPAAAPADQRKKHGVLPKLRLALVVVGALLLVSGGARWATAGSTAGNLIAAGAVSANDGSTMTIQFTANDGELHKFTNKSNAALIPGSAVQVAYKSGAADKTAKQVGPIESARSLGISLLVTGAVLVVFAGLVTLIIHRRTTL